MWVKFERDFPYHIPEHKGRATIHYKAGETYNVRRECGERAIAGKYAKAVKSPRQKQEENESRPTS